MPTTDASALAAKIRKARMRSKMTQARFARSLGVRQSKLSDWERGKRLRGILDAMALLKAFGGR